jgi:integrase
MGIYKRGDTYWYRFNWHGERIRESTKQSNGKVARQIEAARRIELAKGEVGIREWSRCPTLKDFAESEFLGYVESRFASKPATLAYYKFGIKRLTEFTTLANRRLNAITTQDITAFVESRRRDGLEVSSINRQLEVLRRMLKLATEWGKVKTMLPRVSMLPGQKRRERVLSPDEQAAYLKAAAAIGERMTESYHRALNGIRATQRGEEPIKPPDPYLLHGLATILVECALRPDEAYRLRWDEIRDGTLCIAHGKTDSARRVIPLPQRAAAVIGMRQGSQSDSPWVFPAPTASGHIEQSSIKKPHAKACQLAAVEYFAPYTLRHTCLTRWATTMDPYTLAYLAGHSDFATTRRYVHPRKETVLDAIARAEREQTGHKLSTSSTTPEKSEPLENVQVDESLGDVWRARRDSNPRPIGSKPIALSS